MPAEVQSPSEEAMLRKKTMQHCLRSTAMPNVSTVDTEIEHDAAAARTQAMPASCLPPPAACTTTCFYNQSHTITNKKSQIPLEFYLIQEKVIHDYTAARQLPAAADELSAASRSALPPLLF